MKQGEPPQTHKTNKTKGKTKEKPSKSQKHFISSKATNKSLLSRELKKTEKNTVFHPKKESEKLN